MKEKECYLLDDYNKNIYEFIHAGGRGIKFHNDVNHRGLGTFGGCVNGIILFAPNIIPNNIAMFDKAFDFIETALENGFTKETCLRGFGNNKWSRKF